jgi:uncharacterized membrane protein YbhN (UPF0104 family)
MGESQRGTAVVWLRRAAPWLIAVGILAFLGATMDLNAVAEAVAKASLPGLLAVVVALVTTMVVTDTLALWVAFREAIPDAQVTFAQTLTARAPTYLLAIVNYGAGQGGVVYFLKRNHGVAVAEGVGAVLLTTAAYLLVVTALVGGGLLAGALPDEPELRWAVIALAAGAPVYLAVVALRPGWLTALSLLKPLFAAGVAGTLRVAAARVVYVLFLMAGHWAAMRLFGIEVPIGQAMTRLPLLFLLGAIPISPAGLGTIQAAAIALFSDYAPGATPAARHAVVLAYSLSVQVVGTALLAAIGLAFLRRATRTT